MISLLKRARFYTNIRPHIPGVPTLGTDKISPGLFLVHDYL